MLETAVIALFCVILFAAVILDWSLIAALAVGLALFWCYGLLRHYSVRALADMTVQGFLKSTNILITLALIGMLTALWRSCGTIPYLVTKAAAFFAPSVMLLMIFLMNSFVSFLIGTSFGTSATMGTVCMTIAGLMGVDPIWAGGAVISGIFVGDRCSPLSTSAMLVAASTETDLYDNIRGMIKTGTIPFLLTAAAYTVIGFVTSGNVGESTAVSLFADSFVLKLPCVIPAVVVIGLVLLKIPVRYSVIVSSLCAMGVGYFLQGQSVRELLSIAISGYHPTDPAIRILAGGGILSMANVVGIVAVASTYSGIFEGTGMIDNLAGVLERLGEKITPFGSVTAVSILLSAIACNQTLPVILAAQLCKKTMPDKQELAIAIENTAIVIAAWIPWSVAISAPLAAMGATAPSILAALYLFILPGYCLIESIVKRAAGRKRARA